MEKTIEIPEGYEARIEGNKVILERKESEDEKIRRGLLKIFNLFKQSPNEWGGMKIKDIIAYLERQKEQKPIPTEDEKDFLEKEVKAFLCNYDKEFDDDAPAYDIAEHFYQLGKNSQKLAEWSEEDKVMLNNIIWSVHMKSIIKRLDEMDDRSRYKKYEDFLKALPERFNLQPKQEWSEEYREEDLRTRFAFYTYKDEDGVLYLSNVFVEETSRNKGFGTKILQAAEMVAQTIGALTIRLKVKQNTLANDWYRRHGYGYLVFEDGYDWLEKNLEYLKPKQKWGEEDEEKLSAVISLMRTSRAVDPFYDKMCLEGWLKSLRPTWKPSEEQMEALDDAIGMFGYMRMADTLRELYADLKKL